MNTLRISGTMQFNTDRDKVEDAFDDFCSACERIGVNTDLMREYITLWDGDGELVGQLDTF